MTRRPQPRRPKSAPKTPPIDNTSPTDIGHPLFAQPQTTPDPTKVKVRHPSDNPAYRQIDQLNAAHKLEALPFPAPRGLPEPLGDVIYSFGEGEYYYDQFYEPYRNYMAPIVALAGNHDGMVAPGANASTLTAFLENFCSERFDVAPEAGGLSRTTQIQPGVFYTFEAPLL
ncbi:MAG: hypothetical protein WCD52_00975, partial [Xanthobacteraceae bacterium]